MTKFLFLFRYPQGFSPSSLEPEEMQQLVQKWQAWIGEGMQKGWLTQPGERLSQEGRVVHPKQVVMDGPFVESKEIVAGYCIVQAASLEAATEYAKSCPALLKDGKVEIRPINENPAAKR